jgi:hypothetical protein
VSLVSLQFSFSGVTSDPVHATLITSTIIVVFFTTLVCILLNLRFFSPLDIHSNGLKILSELYVDETSSP